MIPPQPRIATRATLTKVVSTALMMSAGLGLVLSRAATFDENFAVDPTTRGWQIHGDTNQFTWDHLSQKLHVIWDSSKSNSFFHRPLGTILTSEDDFSFSFDLTLDDYTIGTTPGKSSTFEIAIGLLNLAQATQTNFFRGAGVNATYGPKNLIEFNFFPAFDFFLPTLGQVLVSTNNAWLYNDDNLLDLTPGETFQVHLSYAAAARTLSTSISNNATQYGQTQTIVVPANFDFRVSSLAISSYSDLIQPPPAGSILAYGTVDNISINVPPPPLAQPTGAFAGTTWQLQFLSQTNWSYGLERTTNFATWETLPASVAGNGATLILTDAAPPPAHAFYRVTANRP